MRVVPVSKALVRAQKCKVIDANGQIFIPFSEAKVPVNDKGVWETGLRGPVGPPGPAGLGLPKGGQPGQTLVKSGVNNYATMWVSKADVAAIPLNVIDSLLESAGFSLS